MNVPVIFPQLITMSLLLPVMLLDRLPDPPLSPVMMKPGFWIPLLLRVLLLPAAPRIVIVLELRIVMPVMYLAVTVPAAVGSVDLVIGMLLQDVKVSQELGFVGHPLYYF